MSEYMYNQCSFCGHRIGGKPVDVYQAICSSCGIQFGYTDRSYNPDDENPDQAQLRLRDLWRQAWIDNGGKPVTKEQQKTIFEQLNSEFPR